MTYNVSSGTLNCTVPNRMSVCSSRECGAERLLKLLSMEDESSRKLPSVSDVDLDRLHDIFVVKSPRTLSADCLPSVCQVAVVYH